LGQNWYRVLSDLQASCGLISCLLGNHSLTLHHFDDVATSFRVSPKLDQKASHVRCLVFGTKILLVEDGIESHTCWLQVSIETSMHAIQ
jgi:hypothetical protein